MRRAFLCLAAGLLAATGVAFAGADYRDLTMEQMVEQRSKWQEMTPDDRKAFQLEMRSRMQAMSPEERSQWQKRMHSAGGAAQKRGYGGDPERFRRGRE